ncbi:MAG: sigma-70 family RNA polymerase sigma factor [Elusimicrobiota bacterium]
MNQQDDYGNIEEIIKEYNKKIFNMLCSLSGNIEEAKDLTQETFIKAYRKLRSFQNRSDIYTWLYRIAVNCWKNKVRYNRRRGIYRTISIDAKADDNKQTIADKIEDKTASGEQKAIHEDMQKRIDIEMHLLPPKYQIPLTLHIKELSYEEISKILKCSVGTAKSLVFRAKEKLKEKIMPYL